VSGSKKVAASTPQKRPTTTMQRPFQPGTRTSNTTGQRALPPGKKGGALAKVTKALPAGVKGGSLKVAGKALSTLGKVGLGLGAAGTVLAIKDTANSVFNPKSEGNQQLGKAMAAVNKRYSGKYGPRFKNAGTGPSTAKGTKPKASIPKGSSDALREKSYASLQKFQVPKTKPTPKPATPKTAPARSSTPARTASRPAAKPAAKPKAQTNMATESSMSASDIMKGYGMRVNQTFSAESPSTPKKRESLKDQTASIKKMIEESKKRQGKG
jgi:hypothetical protein